MGNPLSDNPIRRRKPLTWQEVKQLVEAYALTGSIAAAAREVGVNYPQAYNRYKRDQGRGIDDWDLQANSLRRHMVGEAEKRIVAKVVRSAEKLLDRAQETVDNPAYRVRGSVGNELKAATQAVNLVLSKPTEIVDLGTFARWWSSLSPEQQREELRKAGVTVVDVLRGGDDTAGSGVADPDSGQ